MIRKLYLDFKRLVLYTVLQCDFAEEFDEAYLNSRWLDCDLKLLVERCEG